MSDDNANQRDFIAKSAFILMLAGVLAPLIVAAAAFLMPGLKLSPANWQTILTLVVGFSFLSEVLALVLGIVSRQQLLGKAAICGSSTLLVLAVLAVAFLIPVSVRQVHHDAPAPIVVPTSK
jgi:hypothetical protein